MNFAELSAKAWRAYANAAGILIIGGLISWALLVSVSQEGPVVQTIEGPEVMTATVPFEGELAFRLSVQRNMSCPGLVVHRFISMNAGKPGTLIVPALIHAPDIKTTHDLIVRVGLSPSIFRGNWRYEYGVSSECPTFQRYDLLAAFVIEVE